MISSQRTIWLLVAYVVDISKEQITVQTCYIVHPHGRPEAAKETNLLQQNAFKSSVLSNEWKK